MSHYLAFEGIDGAGKSTVSRLVADRIEAAGHEVVRVREPGGTRTGEAIREILLGTGSLPDAWAEALLFAAARSQLASEVVAPALGRGAIVVSDRSVYSSIAYQGAARGLGVEAVRMVNAAGLRGVWPDTVILLRLDPARGLQRESEADRISAEGLELQHLVAEGYEALAADEPERFIVIDAEVGVEAVVERSVELLETRL